MRVSIGRAAVCVALGLLLLGGLTFSSAAELLGIQSAVASTSGPLLAPPYGAMAGVFNQALPYNMRAFDSYSRQFGKRPAMVMWFQAWDTAADEQFKAAECAEILRRGAIPMITWEPWNPFAGTVDQPGYSLQTIIDGKHDAYIRSWAQGAKSVPGPIMLRPLHEMNGYWYSWGGTVNGNSPTQFKAAWRHIVDIFREEGATNVTWVWSPNWISSPYVSENAMSLYYPGSTYVDWLSSSGYNWGTTRTTSKWMTFDQIYATQLAYFKTLNKPVVLAEVACVPDGGDKAAWITNMYSVIRAKYPQVKGVIWFDKREVGNGTQDWQIASSHASWLAYRKATLNSYYRAGSSTSLLTP